MQEKDLKLEEAFDCSGRWRGVPAPAVSGLCPAAEAGARHDALRRGPRRRSGGIFRPSCRPPGLGGAGGPVLALWNAEKEISERLEGGGFMKRCIVRTGIVA